MYCSDGVLVAAGPAADDACECEAAVYWTASGVPGQGGGREGGRRRITPPSSVRRRFGSSALLDDGSDGDRQGNAPGASVWATRPPTLCKRPAMI